MAGCSMMSPSSLVTGSGHDCQVMTTVYSMVAVLASHLKGTNKWLHISGGHVQQMHDH